MEEQRLERWAGIAALLVCGSVALPVVLGAWTGTQVLTGPAWLFWLAYATFLGSLASVDHAHERMARFTPAWAVAVMAVSGWIVAATAASTGWSIILIVFTAAVAASVLPPWATSVLIAFQTGLVFVIASEMNDSIEGALLGTVVYGALQVLCAVGGWSERRNAEVRDELAATNVELRAATALLAESSRAEERLRIARELHDVLGHQLTVLALELEVAAHRASPPAAEHVERARGVAKALLSDVRSTVGELRDRPGDLGDALEHLTRDLVRPHTHVRVDDDLDLDDASVASLLRCVQEIVTNTIRHADADELWIEVTGDARGGLALYARDDGHGTTMLRLGNGLTGLRERIAALGGEVDFATHGGFEVRAHVPAQTVRVGS